MDLKMQVFNEIPEVSDSIITIGSFDGLHLGHQNLLQFMKNEANKRGLKDYVITFDPHPRTVLKNYNSFRLINEPNEKIHLFQEKGIERTTKNKFYIIGLFVFGVVFLLLIATTSFKDWFGLPDLNVMFNTTIPTLILTYN
jgi:hypothetical protein